VIPSASLYSDSFQLRLAVLSTALYVVAIFSSLCLFSSWVAISPTINGSHVSFLFTSRSHANGHIVIVSFLSVFHADVNQNAFSTHPLNAESPYSATNSSVCLSLKSAFVASLLDQNPESLLVAVIIFFFAFCASFHDSCHVLLRFSFALFPILLHENVQDTDLAHL
jgi:hypothetical protein